MKKKNILNLIKYYAEKNDTAFRNEAYEIAKYFDSNNDAQLSEYIMAVLADANTLSPQTTNKITMRFIEPMVIQDDSLPLPEELRDNILGILNAISHNNGVNKFLFAGAPGTGKTETAKQVARILKRELFVVNFDVIIDSKLGQTAKNIAVMFEELNNISHPENVIILMDEIDALAMDRINHNDLREMGRATSAILKGLDSFNNKLVLIATTNLYSSFDKALIRRFDSVIDFNVYSQEDLLLIAESLLNKFLAKFKFAGRNIHLFRKIIKCMNPIPYPGELKNLIKTALAFSSSEDEFDYLRRLYYSISKKKEISLKDLQNKGFTVREIEILTGVSKSSVSRELKGLKL
ncbi:AAA family ATPase [Candidatus Avelusimicrobium fimicolum]|uniref:AAA family ATPase n=1 Tax=Candidatus Avelusimicrobium fimicolum TaxID=3416216 RepID=UPI003D142D8A